MRVTVKLFGPAAEAAGASQVDVDIDGMTATATDVKNAIRSQHEAIGAYVDASRLAINHEFAAPNAAVSESDELALIGQVSGG